MKMFKKIFIFLLIVFSLIFVSRDLLLKKILECLFKKNLRIERIQSSFKGIEFKNVFFKKDGLELTSKLIEIKLEGSLFKPKFLIFSVENSYIKIKEDKIKTKFSKNNLPVFFFKSCPLRINLNSLNIEYGENIFLRFSLDADLESNREIVFRSLNIESLNIKRENIKVKNLNFRNIKEDNYEIFIKELKVKDKMIKDLLVPLELYIREDKYRLIFKKTSNLFFGEKGYLEGILEIEDSNFCLDLRFYSFSFKELLDFFIKKDELLIDGLFDGKIFLCKNYGGFKIEGSFDNEEGGLVCLKKETGLEFLKKYLTLDSYNLLIDSFKNYKYNKCKIILNQEDKDLVITLKFNSFEFGDRNITIDLHKILGGER
ncbi:MAG: hypothetical protein QXZ20_01925 [Candidatus Aenigmatarchaeota archaeon]